jgi:hypothetical protein
MPFSSSIRLVDISVNTGAGDSCHPRRDLYDRCERPLSLCTFYYELCGDLVDGYISLSLHQLNNTMKIMTIITAIFYTDHIYCRPVWDEFCKYARTGLCLRLLHRTWSNGDHCDRHGNPVPKNPLALNGPVSRVLRMCWPKESVLNGSCELLGIRARCWAVTLARLRCAMASHCPGARRAVGRR